MSLKNINPNIGKLMESPIMQNILAMQSQPTPKLVIPENPVHKTMRKKQMNYIKKVKALFQICL